MDLNAANLKGLEMPTENDEMNPTIRLSENIALLWVLDEVPQAAGSNAHPKPQLDQHQRLLSLEQEKELCTALAFLAGVSDNPNHVMAVAVEERHEPRGLHVKVAINKSKPGDGQEALLRVIDGFRDIFRLLSLIARGGQSDTPKVNLLN